LTWLLFFVVAFFLCVCGLPFLHFST
jgi:hypothetical protein